MTHLEIRIPSDRVVSWQVDASSDPWTIVLDYLPTEVQVDAYKSESARLESAGPWSAGLVIREVPNTVSELTGRSLLTRSPSLLSARSPSLLSARSPSLLSARSPSPSFVDPVRRSLALSSQVTPRMLPTPTGSPSRSPSLSSDMSYTGVLSPRIQPSISSCEDVAILVEFDPPGREFNFDWEQYFSRFGKIIKVIKSPQDRFVMSAIVIFYDNLTSAKSAVDLSNGALFYVNGETIKLNVSLQS